MIHRLSETATLVGILSKFLHTTRARSVFVHARHATASAFFLHHGVRMHDERCVPLTHGCWRELATARVIDTRDLPTVAVPAPWRVWAAQWAAAHVALRPGTAWIDPPHVIDDNEGETCRVMAAAVAPHGYVAVHAGATWPREVWRTLCHRHVLLIPGDAPPMRVAALVRVLVGVISRPHPTFSVL